MTNSHNTPATTRVWHVNNPHQDAPKDNFKTTLTLSTTDVPDLGPNDVVHAVSLNWRDIMILTNTYIRPMPDSQHFVPVSDGAGIVLAVGSQVTRFRPDDRVAAIFFPGWRDGLLRMKDAVSALGAEVEGMLREHAVINEEGLVKIPDYLSFEEASTLPCAGVTAWNALFGHGPTRTVGRCLQPGESVLTQGSGGVSLFVAQFGTAAGANVFSTTSSSKKADKIETLTGVPRTHIINYREIESWGTEVKKLTRNGEGVDFVVEVTGSDETMKQSYEATRPEAQVSVIGTRGAAKSDGSEIAREKRKDGKEVKVGNLANAMHYIATTRRIAVGSREMFEAMNKFLDEKKIHPVVDDKIFEFEEAREAMMYLWQGKHFGNIVIRIQH